MPIKRPLKGARLLLRSISYWRAMRRSRAEYDAFIISFPKCGRTWHRAMLGHYLCRLLGCDPRSSLQIGGLLHAAKLRRVTYSHNGASPNYLLPPNHHLVAWSREWESKDVLMLVRDPRDVMISAHRHLTRRDPLFSGDLSEYIRTPPVGVPKLVSAWRRWHENRHLAKSFSVISYENMHKDPSLVLRTTLQFVGVEKIDECAVADSVEFASFANLQSLEQSNYFFGRTLGRVSDDPAAAKVRQGRIGGHLDVLTTDDRGYIEKSIAEIGDPFNTL